MDDFLIIVLACGPLAILVGAKFRRKVSSIDEAHREKESSRRASNAARQRELDALSLAKARQSVPTGSDRP